ncbi:18.5 kDa class I heat shock protein-like [Phragmites australis]|uniref:18.5 kDa class I heat shock protein-like n=1 Tax=Phragmites australis TaxID=29695 RepID=UPI002D79944D|nr:18.5 kDa class I heat shock protein-like [Phragmites australis]
MDAARRPRFLAEIDPHSEWVRGREFDALIVDVAGFSKEQLKVLVERSGRLKVSGERAVDESGRQWCHFLKSFDLPAGCDAAAVRVQLDKGTLYVQVPRPGATGGGGSEQHPAEMYDDALRGEEIGDGGWTGRGAAARRDEHPVGRLARGLSRHRQVVLNVVLAVVLLWLVAFANNTPSGGHAKND